MANLTVGTRGEIELPSDMRSRYGLAPHTLVRILETRCGILVIPLHDQDMDPELAAELEEWQALAGHTLEAFPYDEDAGPELK